MELLVVIAIISVLAAVVLASLNEARKGARDKTRKIELKQLQLAIEIYREASGAYPSECLPDTTTWAGPGPH